MLVAMGSFLSDLAKLHIEGVKDPQQGTVYRVGAWSLMTKEHPALLSRVIIAVTNVSVALHTLVEQAHPASSSQVSGKALCQGYVSCTLMLLLSTLMAHSASVRTTCHWSHC